MADTVPVTELQQAFPSLAAQQPATSSGTSEATKVPLGSTKGNYFGKEAETLKKRGEINREIGKSVQEEGENLLNRAVIGQEEAGETADVGKANLTELQALRDQHNAELNKLIDQHRPIVEAVDKFKFHDHWSEPHVGQGILAAIASGLLGFGTGQYHNVAKEIADADHAKQVNEFNSLLERARMNGADEDRLMKIQERGSAALSTMQAAKYKAIADKYALAAAQATTVEAKTAAQQKSLYFQKLANEENQKTLEGLRTSAGRNVSHAIRQSQATKVGF